MLSFGLLLYTPKQPTAALSSCFSAQTHLQTAPETCQMMPQQTICLNLKTMKG
jgi:hypothetical protein